MTFDDVKESAAMAIETVRTNKLRSSLTILGVTVGVVTVIFMVSIIQGLNKAFSDQIESLVRPMARNIVRIHQRKMAHNFRHRAVVPDDQNGFRLRKHLRG